MSGRSERVNAKDIESSAWAIMFEADEARVWLEGLAERARKNAEKSHANGHVAPEHAMMMESFAVKCTHAAYDLASITEWVAAHS